jgi:hypothetical protein
MKLRTSSLAAVLCLAAPLLAGCAGEEAEAGEAAYPPVGYTPPGKRAAETTVPAPNGYPDAPPPGGPPVAPARRSADAPVATGDWQWAPSAEDGADADPQASGDDAQGGAPDDSNGAYGGQGGGYVYGPPGNPPPPVGAHDFVQGGGPPPSAAQGGYADTDPSALTDFRSTLDPYGTWTEDSTYGTVWVPSPSVVGPEFTPYVSAGHWVYDDDYTWVSDYDWGWAPFHYGRWVYGDAMGWEWIPGRDYAGAWVSWRYGLDDWAYVGWAPLAPTWCWRRGAAVGIGFVPRAPYTFVGTGELFTPSLGGRVLAGAQVGIVAAHTRPYVPGPTSTGMAAAGRVAARPAVGGPPLSELHIGADSVGRATTDNRGLAQARAFARPSTAMPLGARPPAYAGYDGRVAAWQARGTGPAPAYHSYSRTLSPSSPTESHFGGRLGAGFAGSPASARPYYGPSRGPAPPTAYRPYGAPSTVRGYSGPGGAYRAAPSAPYTGGVRPPASAGYGGAPRAPAVSAPRAPSFSGGAPRAPQGAVRAGGGGGGHAGHR